MLADRKMNGFLTLVLLGVAATAVNAQFGGGFTGGLPGATRTVTTTTFNNGGPGFGRGGFNNGPGFGRGGFNNGFNNGGFNNGFHHGPGRFNSFGPNRGGFGPGQTTTIQRTVTTFGK